MIFLPLKITHRLFTGFQVHQALRANPTQSVALSAVKLLGVVAPKVENVAPCFSCLVAWCKPGIGIKFLIFFGWIGHTMSYSPLLLRILGSIRNPSHRSSVWGDDCWDFLRQTLTVQRQFRDMTRSVEIFGQIKKAKDITYHGTWKRLINWLLSTLFTCSLFLCQL